MRTTPSPLLPLAWAGSAHGAPDVRTAVRVWALSAAHLVALYADCRIHSPCFSWKGFILKLCCALAYVAPVYPVLLVSGSVALLVGSRLVGVPLARAHSAISWGSMHLPLWSVYFHCRRACLSGAAQSLLPCRAPSPPLDARQLTQVVDVRAQRLAFFGR